MRVRVRLFGSEARAIGAAEVTLDLPGMPTAAAVLETMGRDCPALRGSLSHARLAVNHEFAAPGDPVHAGDELALIGMVSGG